MLVGPKRLVSAMVCTPLLLAGCQSQPTGSEVTGTSAQALSSTNARVLGFEDPLDWTATAGPLSSATRHVEGTKSLSWGGSSTTTITSRALSSLGSDVGTLLGFDILIPEAQPDPSWFGSAQLYVSIPSRGVNNVLVGQRDLTYMPRGIFRRVEFSLLASLRSALQATYSDLRFSLVLSVPQGAGPYLFDRLSFVHGSSEPVDSQRNAAILAFEAPSAWIPSVGTATLVGRRTDKMVALSVVPQGWTVLTSERLATPAISDGTVGYDLLLPATPPGAWAGETQLYVDLPSQGIVNAFVGRRDLAGLPPDTFTRIAFALPTAVSSKLAQEFDDLRFKIVLNTASGTGPYLLDRFDLAAVTSPTESVDVVVKVPTNVAASRLLFLAQEGLTIDPGVKFARVLGTNFVAASLGSTGIDIGANADVDSLVSFGPVRLGTNTRVHGYVSGTSNVMGTGLISGQVSAVQPVTRDMHWTATFEPTTHDVVVNAGAQVTLAPGRYRTVKVLPQGLLRMSPGTFRVDHFLTEPGGTVTFDSDAGNNTTFVRSILDVAGPVKDDALADPQAPPPTHGPTWVYSGGKNPKVPVYFPPRLVAPNVTVDPSPLIDLPPRTGGIWAKGIRLRDPGKDYVPVPPPLSRVATGVQVPEQDEDPEAGSTFDKPVYVRRDNPQLFGTFEWRTGEAGQGTGPYFQNGTWTGVTQAHLAMRWFPANEPGWTAPLLPGVASQSASTDASAYFQSRTFDLNHATQVWVMRSGVHADQTRISRGGDLYLQLSSDVLIVPVVIIGWDGPDHAESLRAQFDFIRSDPFAPSPPDTEPTPAGPFGSPGVFPPDDVWEQCGIAFRVVKTLWLDEPDVKTKVNVCDEGSPSAQDYVEDYPALFARIQQKLSPEEYAELFGDGGLAPVLIQYGAIPTYGGPCAAASGGYFGKADVATSRIQINNDFSSVTAHELGHVLWSASHSGSGDSPNLMASGASHGTYIPPDQCTAAANRARSYDQRYLEYAIRHGLARAPNAPRPPRVDAYPAAEAGQHPIYNGVCCALEAGRKVRTLGAFCMRLAGQSTQDCSVCCADPSIHDDRASFGSLDLDACEPENVATSEKCANVKCCRAGLPDKTMPLGDCDRLGGSICPPPEPR